jgi:hypothetical protein
MDSHKKDEDKMSKPLAFVSYIHEDEDFAIGLRDWIKDALLGGIELFLAGDRGSIPLGSEWPKKIISALRGCAAAILIISPQSIDRKWIYFEAGAALARKVPVIPVCCNGLGKNDLSPPLSFLQAVQLPNEADEKFLLAELSKVCGLEPPKKPPSLELEKIHITSDVTPSKETEKSDILDKLFEKRLSKLILEWRDKILEKVDQLKGKGVSLINAKQMLRTYFQRLYQDREKYVQEAEQQIKTIPETMKREHPEGGLNINIAIAATTFAMSDYIKSSKSLLEVLPELERLCGENETTFETLNEFIRSKFDELLFQIE